MNNTITNSYKKTSIGLIPLEWEVKHLKDLTTLITKGTTPEKFVNNGINFIKTECFIGDKIDKNKCLFIDENTHYNFLKRSILFENDILFAIAGSIGKSNIVTKEILPANVNQALAIIRLKDFELIKYITQVLKSNLVDRYIYSNVSVGAQPNLNLEQVGNFNFPFPPLPEQQKIAEILSTWDEAIANCKKTINSIRDRNKGLAQQLLSGKMRLKGYEKSQWHLKSVEEVAVFKNGKAHENCIDENGDYFVVNSKFISTQGKVAKASNENLCPLFKNDITMVMSDIPNGKALAKCFYIPEDDKYTLNQRICALTAKDGTDSKFLYYQMNRNNYYLAFNNGVSQTNLKKEEVLECPLLMPDIEEQIQIVKVLETADQELKSYEAKLEALQLQKKGLMQQLLTGKIRVNVK